MSPDLKRAVWLCRGLSITALVLGIITGRSGDLVAGFGFFVMAFGTAVVSEIIHPKGRDPVAVYLISIGGAGLLSSLLHHLGVSWALVTLMGGN